MISLEKASLTLAGPNNQPVSILQEIDLQVQSGEAVSIVGPSGSGKTSLMMLIAGVEQATGGKLHVAGKDITHFSEDELAEFRRKTVSIVFQNFHLIPTMTALENVVVALELSAMENSEQKARKSLKEVGLEHRVDHYPEQLSGGEQQRVALARAFAIQPKLLLADEPTGNLDSENGKKIVELLFKLQKEYGTTLVLITHDKELAAKTLRQLTMKDGRLS